MSLPGLNAVDPNCDIRPAFPSSAILDIKSHTLVLKNPRSIVPKPPDAMAIANSAGDFPVKKFVRSSENEVISLTSIL